MRLRFSKGTNQILPALNERRSLSGNPQKAGKEDNQVIDERFKNASPMTEDKVKFHTSVDGGKEIERSFRSRRI